MRAAGGRGKIVSVMRSLLMFRHAKSDWHVDYGNEDRLRPLAPRGRRAARTMGRFLATAGQIPDRALVSPAVRARETLELAIRAGRWDCEVVTTAELYGGVDDVLDAIRRDGGDAGVLMIVGHEPTWSATASRLANGAAFRLPTASVLRLDFDVDEWAAVGANGSVQWLVAPRLVERLFS